MSVAAELQGYFAERTATEVVRAINDGALSASDVIAGTLAGIDRANPDLNAFTFIDRAGAIARAQQLDELAAADHGPLHGVPIAIKDIIDVAGLPITRGSGVFADRVAATDAKVVTRLRDAGAIIVGITTTHEFAYGGTGDCAYRGPVHNPHDLTRMTGGSSAGSAAAVAAGLVPIALGTDTGGSIRLPASLCGIVGLKPGYQTVPTEGIFPLATSLDHPGPLTRTLEDCELAYRVLDPSYHASAPAPRIELLSPTPQLLARSDIWELITATVRAKVPDAAPRTIDQLDDLRETMLRIFHREAGDVHRELLASNPNRYQPETAQRLTAGGTITDEDYAAAKVRQAELIAWWTSQTEPGTVIACPAAGFTAPLIGERQSVIDGIEVPTLEVIVRHTRIWNLLGVPALVVPAGEIDGLPVGLQLIGRPGETGTLFAAARQLGY
ncbi:MAG: amidase [Antricoccus sp.]